MLTNSKQRGLIVALGLVVAILSFYYAHRSASPIAPAEPETTPDAARKTAPISREFDRESLRSLEASYQQKRTSAARIRIQSAISDIPPSDLPISQFLSEISNPHAATHYKLFLARTLRNGAKRGLVSERRNQILSGFQSILEQENASEEFLAGLALALIDTDESAPTISSLARLLERLEGDMNAAATVNSIARSSRSEAKEALFNFVVQEAQSPTSRPTALAEALIPLSYESDLPIEPMLIDIVSKTQDTRLFAASLKALSNRPASEKKTLGLKVAKERIPSFPQELQSSLIAFTPPSLAAQNTP